MKHAENHSTGAAVVCIALNPALDQTIEVRNLRPGEVNRALRAQIDVGGKGINVASCLADYRDGVSVTGMLGNENAGLFEQLFDQKSILNRCVYVDGMTRVNTKLIDPAQGMTTDINMPGPALSEVQVADKIEQLLAAIDELAATARWFVLSGSLPPGWPADTYTRLIERIRGHSRRVLLDASGEALREGLRGHPHILKPNEAELSELLGRALQTPAEIAAAVGELMQQNPGVECVVVSMGGDGALFFDRHEHLHAQALRVELMSTVGAGDAMVAGLVAGMLEGLCLTDCARLATAFSATKLALLGPHLPAPQVVRQRMEEVLVSAL